MSLKVYFKVACFVTVMCLLYIHMQMRIFELSYNGKDKEKIIHELNDSNGALSHQILTLESANNLGNKLLDKDNSLQFMDNERIMTVRTSVGAMQRFTKPQTRTVAPVWNFVFILRCPGSQGLGVKLD